MSWRVAFSLGVAVWIAYAQLPPSPVLSAREESLFRSEIARIEQQLSSHPRNCGLTYQMARTWASAKQWAEAMRCLQRITELRAGFDPSRDRVFDGLRGTHEFAALLQATEEATPPVLRSHSAFTMTEGDLVPESLAYDPSSKRFYFGSMRKGKVMRCSPAGDCENFLTGLDMVLGLKVHGRTLWLLNNSEAESSLNGYDLTSGNLLHKHFSSGPGHLFNDLTVAPDGAIYLSDTRAGTVWYLRPGAASLAKISGQFTAANGIAITPDARLLFVATFPDGVTTVDLRTGNTAPLTYPPNLCLANIDGLYVHRNTLIAIQNGFMSPRVVRLILRRDRHSVARAEILERRNHLFDGVTTGVLSGEDFFYMANIQDNKTVGFDPISILRLHL